MNAEERAAIGARHVSASSPYWSGGRCADCMEFDGEDADYVRWPCDAARLLAALAAAEARGERLTDALNGMVTQFAYWSNGAGGYWTGGLSALEDAFDVLGWDDPHPAPEARCDEPGCMEQSSCGWPTRPGGTGDSGGYRRTCGDHMRAARDGGQQP